MAVSPPLTGAPLGAIDPVLATIEGAPIRSSAITPLLVERAGAEVLGEMVLDHRLALAMSAEGLALSETALEVERQLLEESLSPDPNLSARLLDALQSRQGLGPRRFAALLRRNAMLRALVTSQALVTDDLINQTFDALHGPKRQPRLIVVASAGDANQLLLQVEQGAGFIDLAIRFSLDESARRGGLLEPISRLDPVYPSVIRESLFALDDGAISAPILIDGGYALLQLEQSVAADGIALSQVRPAIRQLAQRNLERILMELRARQELERATMTIFDDDLHGAWMRARQSG